MPTEGEPSQEEQQMEWEQRGREGRGGEGRGGEEGCRTRRGKSHTKPGTKIHGEGSTRLVQPRELNLSPH